MVKKNNATIEKQIQEIEDALKEEREKVIVQVLEQLTDQIDQEAANGMMTKKNILERTRLQLEEKAKTKDIIGAILEGFDVIGAHYKETLSSEEVTRFVNDIKASEEARGRLGESKQMSPIPQETYKISDFLMNAFYKIGFMLFERRDFEEAKSVFVLLATLNTFVPDYTTAVAIVCQQLGQPQEAIPYAYFSTLTEPDNPRNHIMLGRLLLSVGKKSEAQEEVEAAEKLISIATEDSPYKADLGDLLNLKEAVSKT